MSSELLKPLPTAASAAIPASVRFEAPSETGP